MKRQKKILVVLLLFEVLLVVLPLIIDGLGYKNGHVSYSYNPYHHSDQTEWYEDKYGTHDWIAEAALDAVLADSTSKNKWEGENGQFWTEKRKVCFLIGTEAPDTTGNTDSKKGYTYLYLNGKKCTGMQVKTVMRFYNYITGDNRLRPKPFASFVSRASEWTDTAKRYLRQGKCDAAAFYMGAITHLIADMASWPHTLYHTDVDYGLDVQHGNFELAVQKETKSYKDRTRAFSYPKNFPVLSVDPQPALRLVAFDTRWDYSISKADINIKPYPSYVIPGSDDSKSLYDTFDSYSSTTQKEVSSWISGFKDRVQEHLDKAVKYCAYAINFIADAWAEGDNPKYCEDCSSGSDDNSKKSRFSRKFGEAISMLILLGLANAMLVPLLQIMSYSTAMH